MTIMRQTRLYLVRRAAFQIVGSSVLGLGLALAGCSGMTLPVADPVTGTPATTSTIPETVDLPTGFDRRDAESINQALAKEIAETPEGETIAFATAATGSHGTLEPSGMPAEVADRLCRPFVMTFHSISGVEQYHGQACRGEEEVWGLADLKAVDPAT